MSGAEPRGGQPRVAVVIGSGGLKCLKAEILAAVRSYGGSA